MELDITLLRALKIYWSFAWRALLLSLAVVLPLDAVFFALILPGMPKPGQPADPQAALRVATLMAIAWPFFMAAVILVQTQAVRWMVRKARWSDFRLALVPRDAEPDSRS